MALMIKIGDTHLTNLPEKNVIFKPPINVQGKLRVEVPCCLSILGGLFVMKDLTVGAFTYISGNFSSVYSIRIGRYCSFGIRISCKGDHPMHYFTMSPIFFNPKNPFSFDQTKVAPDDFIFRTPRSLKSNLEVVIGNDVWIGDDVFIKPGISIGDGSVIGTKAVVTKNVPPYAIVAGIPARVIRYIFEKHVINDLLELKWWEFMPWQLKGAPLDNINEFIEFLKELRRKTIPDKTEWVEI